MIVTALMIAASMRIVGILLVSSLITLPVASAMRITKGFKSTIILSILLGNCRYDWISTSILFELSTRWNYSRYIHYDFNHRNCFEKNRINYECRKGLTSMDLTRAWEIL